MMVDRGRFPAAGRRIDDGDPVNHRSSIIDHQW